jgi:hypothetical protein
VTDGIISSSLFRSFNRADENVSEDASLSKNGECATGVTAGINASSFFRSFNRADENVSEEANLSKRGDEVLDAVVAVDFVATDKVSSVILFFFSFADETVSVDANLLKKPVRLAGSGKSLEKIGLALDLVFFRSFKLVEALVSILDRREKIH